MKIYNVIYIHTSKFGVCDFVIPFLDMEDAEKCYEGIRQDVIETVSDDDPDSDEEVCRDLKIRDGGYDFRCYVPEYDETYVVRIAESDVVERRVSR